MIKNSIAVLAAVFTLVACGGGGDATGCPVPGAPGGGDSGLPDGPTESINHKKPKHPAPAPAPAPEPPASEPSC